MDRELDHPEIREGVARLCADFPGAYWRTCDREQAYPRAFVAELLRKAGIGADVALTELEVMRYEAVKSAPRALAATD